MRGASTNWSGTGLAFERWSTRLLEELGHLNVRHDVTLRMRTREGVVRSQYDIVSGWPAKRYYECKFHLDGSKVPFADVSTFDAKLRLHRIPRTRAYMLTNTDYDTRARAYARHVGIGLIGREDLVLMDWERSRQLISLCRGPPPAFEEGLERRILKERLR